MCISSSLGSSKPWAQLFLRTTCKASGSREPVASYRRVTAWQWGGSGGRTFTPSWQRVKTVKTALPLICFSVCLKVWLPQLISCLSSQCKYLSRWEDSAVKWLKRHHGGECAHWELCCSCCRSPHQEFGLWQKGCHGLEVSLAQGCCGASVFGSGIPRAE